MTRLNTLAARDPSTATVIAQLEARLAAEDLNSKMVFAFYGCGHDESALHEWLGRQFPVASLLGGSSSGGLMTDEGFVDEHGVGLLLIDDEDGDYGVAAGLFGDDATLTAENLLRDALANCGCTGQLPELIWVYQAPGHEEEVLEGLRRVVGDNCPIIGGSSADNDVSGKWTQLGPEGCMKDGLAVGVLFPSTPLGYAFQGGYEPAGPNGIVTGIGFTPAGASGVVTASVGREIISIDNEPAAHVYNRWVENRIDAQLEGGGSILAETTMSPLATDAGHVDGVSHYLLIHPESVSANGTLNTFCNLQVGDRVYAMKGDTERLVDRAGRVGGQARKALEQDGYLAAGGLIVYCGGCKLAVDKNIAKVAGAVAEGLGNVPFIGCFTFGEQGRLIDRNLHGNLMISAVVFSQ
mgnify:CR=1 FL=1